MLKPFVSTAQYSLLNTDAFSKGMGSSYAAISGVWSGTGNPAGLASLEKPSVSLYCENMYLMKELMVRAMVFDFPTQSGIFSISHAAIGTAVLKLRHTCFSFGKQIGKYARAGIGIHYMTIHQTEDYPMLYAFIPSAGLQLVPSNQIVIGICVFNPTGLSYYPTKSENIPGRLTAGIGYLAGENVLITLDVEWMSDQKPVVSGGLEAELNSFLKLRFGTRAGNQPSWSAGAGFVWGKLGIDIAFMHHYALGFSPVMGLTHAFK